MKLDYDVLMFNVISVTQDFIEIEVNKHTEQTAYIRKTSGNFQPWPEFFLSVNSIEFINPESQSVHIKPLENAAEINVKYQFMRPLKVRREWMYVSLLNDNHNNVGKGWIKWNDNGVPMTGTWVMSSVLGRRDVIMVW